MAELPDFARRQYEFAAHIRDPENRPRPADVDERRMAAYRELFFNNVEDFLGNAFPVVSETLGEERWLEMLRDFYANHRAITPLFPEFPGEFLRYLNEIRTPRPDDPPFLADLAHYEWMEIVAAQADTTIDWNAIDADGDLLDGIPVVSPLAWVLGYKFPVHRIGPGFRPDAPKGELTWLIVYRDADDEVRFIETNSVTARLLELLGEGEGLTGRTAMEQLARELGHPAPAAVMEHGHAILADLHSRQIVPGTRRSL